MIKVTLMLFVNLNGDFVYVEDIKVDNENVTNEQEPYYDNIFEKARLIH